MTRAACQYPVRAGVGPAADFSIEAVHERLEQGEAEEARRYIREAIAAESSLLQAAEWSKLRDESAWPDRWLVAAVRRDPPDAAALDTLVDRHWKLLFGRCRLLTLDAEKANDLAQEAWCRVLRARRSLKPEGSFPGYMATIATNLWRDARRSARRSGPLAEHRLSSFDGPLRGGDGEPLLLADVVPDLESLEEDRRRELLLDVDQALARLSPRLREVLIARYLDGASCAEIGKRQGRTEQTISAWVRQAIREMRDSLDEARLDPARKSQRK